MSTVTGCVCEPGFTEDDCLDSGCRACGDDTLADPCREGRSEPTSHAGAANAREVQARINQLHERAAMARDYYVPVVNRHPPRRRDVERVSGDVQVPTPEPRRDVVEAERLRAEALQLDRFAPTAARLHRMAADLADPPVPASLAMSDTDPERCRDCGKVPGKWQPTVSARRDELTLEECRTCGAAWTGRRA